MIFFYYYFHSQFLCVFVVIFLPLSIVLFKSWYHVFHLILFLYLRLKPRRTFRFFIFHLLSLNIAVFIFLSTLVRDHLRNEVINLFSKSKLNQNIIYSIRTSTFESLSYIKNSYKKSYRKFVSKSKLWFI